MRNNIFKAFFLFQIFTHTHKSAIRMKNCTLVRKIDVIFPSFIRPSNSEKTPDYKYFSLAVQTRQQFQNVSVAFHRVRFSEETSEFRDKFKHSFVTMKNIQNEK